MTVKLRRGFKTEAEAYSVEFRQELGIEPHAPLDMFRLAGLLEIPTLRLSAMEDDLPPASYALLTARNDAPFSAVTLFFGRRRAVVFNDSNAPTRQQSDLAHELAHAILGHPPSELTDESGGRHYNETLEAEAICLSGVLLVPRDAAIRLAFQKAPLETAAAQYNISPKLMRMRLHQSGAVKIAARSAAR
jgi:hypothetical protein